MFNWNFFRNREIKPINIRVSEKDKIINGKKVTFTIVHKLNRRGKIIGAVTVFKNGYELYYGDTEGILDVAKQLRDRWKEG
ncbi:hypothetical protein QYM39_06110 [Pediococcus pentosaceus]|uniref:hypothetical protein n=1 Tax=Pediococcus pentosaceus TaxID=1255 RepID=UPI00265808BC|nr:hypothetical protein [Pediococcus pentosaceus]WKF70480.1 hypothetical protein QYM39_06110 [Pediococcus pentosaceus]